MTFYDYHAHSENIEETIKTAKLLGFSGLCFVTNWTNAGDLENFKKLIEPHKKNIDISIGVEIKEKPNKIPELASKLRKSAEVILVHGGDPEVNRVSVETPEIDILVHPESNQENSGLD